ncbi:MAG: rhodanese-like domain-containing protein [Alphaproteobacteria bacterium]|nr:rhodanese-like domain-containing protein [Alphaproteobacteria bacterium]
MNGVQPVDPKTLKRWLDAGEAILIDVREVDEYNKAYISGSILIPVKNCGPEILPQNPDKKIVFHCKSDEHIEKACEVCARAITGPVTYNLEGGIEAWTAEGFEVKHG